MKYMRKLSLAIACGLALAVSGSAQDIKQGLATVVRVTGEASYTLESGPNAKWIPLVAGKILQAGATIKTEPDAMVDVVLGAKIDMPQAQATPDRIGLAPDSAVRGMVDYRPSVEQNMVRLSGDTTLKIDKLTVSDTGVDTVSDTELDLKHGRIFASVKKLSAASQYLVKIPNGIAGVRGTLFAIDWLGWCACIKNSVLESVLVDGKPVTVLVREGNQFNPQGGGQTLPLTPDLIYLFRQIAIALDTLYVPQVSFAFDRTALCFVSPTSGAVASKK